jgi:hypothetical protein
MKIITKFVTEDGSLVVVVAVRGVDVFVAVRVGVEVLVEEGCHPCHRSRDHHSPSKVLFPHLHHADDSPVVCWRPALLGMRIRHRSFPWLDGSLSYQKI